MEKNKLIGLTIVAVKGYKNKDGRVKEPVDPSWIFFNDGKTFIKLEEQEYHDYHDSNPRARVIDLRENEEDYKLFITWQLLIDTDKDINLIY